MTMKILKRQNKPLSRITLHHPHENLAKKTLNGNLALRHAHFEMTQRTFLAHLKRSLPFSQKTTAAILTEEICSQKLRDTRLDHDESEAGRSEIADACRVHFARHTSVPRLFVEDQLHGSDESG
jgi:hypothetical protein